MFVSQLREALLLDCAFLSREETAVPWRDLAAETVHTS